MKEYRLRLIETELDDNFKPIKTRSFENKYISTIPAADNLLLENLKKELFKKYYNEYFNTDKGFVKITNQNHSLSIAPNANAGQRARIDELTKIVKEKDKEINSLIVDYEKRISQEQELMSNMEHRLTEKQNTIDEINKEFVQAVHDWKVLCAEKDTRIAELEDKDWYEACIKQLEEQNNRLIDTLKEKDKEIESLKRVDNIWFDSYQNELNSLRQQLTKLIIEKKQLAIQELEKVKILIQNAINFVRPNFVEVYDAINKQIKELKGEKDEV